MTEYEFQQILIQIRDEMLAEMQEEGFYYKRKKIYDPTS